jgi:hypothetical protein
MNLLQMICCAFFVKGGQLADDYLHTAYGVVQGYRQLRQNNWRLRGLQITTENVDNAVSSILTETVSTGTSMCSCDKISIPATASTTETEDS